MGVEVVCFGYTYSLKLSVIRMSFGVGGISIISFWLGMDCVCFFSSVL